MIVILIVVTMDISRAITNLEFYAIDVRAIFFVDHAQKIIWVRKE